jgi:hypothetical protein
LKEEEMAKLSHNKMTEEIYRMHKEEYDARHRPSPFGNVEQPPPIITPGPGTVPTITEPELPLYIDDPTKSYNKRVMERISFDPKLTKAQQLECGAKMFALWIGAQGDLVAGPGGYGPGLLDEFFKQYRDFATDYPKYMEWAAKAKIQLVVG